MGDKVEHIGVLHKKPSKETPYFTGQFFWDTTKEKSFIFNGEDWVNVDLVEKDYLGKVYKDISNLTQVHVVARFEEHRVDEEPKISYSVQSLETGNEFVIDLEEAEDLIDKNIWRQCD